MKLKLHEAEAYGVSYPIPLEFVAARRQAKAYRTPDYFRIASIKIRPTALLGIVVLKSAESVGAMSAGEAES